MPCPSEAGIISISKAALCIDIIEKTARNRRTVSASLTRHEIKEDFLEELPNFKNKSNTRYRSERNNT